MIEDRTDRQIAYYDPGLGTDWKKVTGAVVGRGFSKNILDCYRFLFDHFEAGDQIFLFGFSRGAATVRSLSAFIHLFGVLPKSRADLIDKAFTIYKIKDPAKRKEKAKVFIDKHHTMWSKIKFLGVWDTVAALGLPVKFVSVAMDRIFAHKFHNFKLSESVEFARQALSIDEERKTFQPVLWENMDIDDKMKQVWFCGVHTDVGGGYKEDALSNISLKWMINEAVSKKLIIYKKSKEYKILMDSDANINGIMHNEQKGFPGNLFKRKAREWNKETHGEPCVHHTVLKRTKNNDNQDDPKDTALILNLMDIERPNIEE